MTGRGTGAISTVQVFGNSAQAVIQEIFRPVGAKTASFETGRVLLGTVTDGAEVIDQVTLGCEGPDNFAIHCHGNPLIVEMIMELLREHGAQLVTAERLLYKSLAVQDRFNTIAIEARLAQAKAKTIEGTKLVANQIEGGLTQAARNWLDGMDKVSLDKTRIEAAEILQNSQAAKLIIYGCTAVLTGPPNSGKSTLLNHLAGRQKAIVTDIRGTTRDWVEAECKIGSLLMTLIDTAGMDAELSGHQPGIDETARNKTTELLERADLILLVLDGSIPVDKLDDELLDKISGRQVIVALNKCDLPVKLDIEMLPKFSSEPVQISSKDGIGMEDLTEKILDTSKTANLDLKKPVCFTQRQEKLIYQLANAEFKKQADLIISDLLRGRM